MPIESPKKNIPVSESAGGPSEPIMVDCGDEGEAPAPSPSTTHPGCRVDFPDLLTQNPQVGDLYLLELDMIEKLPDGRILTVHLRPRKITYRPGGIELVPRDKE